MDSTPTPRASWFQRYLLPGLAFKAVVIGGGYSTGRELAEFFLGSGPRGGLAGMLLAMTIWSLVCAVAFMFAHAAAAYEYRSFFRALLGRYWPGFEFFYLLFLVLILAVVAAAAGTIGAEVFRLPLLAGTLLLVVSIAVVTSFGNRGAEQLFKYASAFIYVVYLLFLVFSLSNFGDRIAPAFREDVPAEGWMLGGITYASYNVVAAIAVLPFIRHMTSMRDAVVAGALAGPLAILPAILFFLCMVGFYPAIGKEALPSDYLLRQMNVPWFQILFQLMIFSALLETGVGVTNAFNERVAQAVRTSGREFPRLVRFAVSTTLLGCSAFVAARIGLVELIARGYGAFGYIMLAVFVLPLLVIGVARLKRGDFLYAGDRVIVDKP